MVSFMPRAFAAVLAALLLTVTTGLPALAAGGQNGNLQGTLVDSVTKAPLANVTISAVSPTGRYSTHTDAKGFFQLIGVTIDTYTLSADINGYDALVLTGITIQGDQTVNLNTLSLVRTLKTIGRTTARSRGSDYHPSQTIDSYTISGEKLLETTGKAATTDETQLALAAPGVSLTSTGGITIRGGLRTEVGYQLDGVDFTEPFFSQNGSNNRFNGIGSLQVVEGAGDATQGNSGAGVLNLIPKRGTNPGTGFVDIEASGPNYGNQAAFEYGAASANGRFSDYVAYTHSRDNPYYGPRGTDAASVGQFYGVGYEQDDQFLNNFVYKFGKDNNQSIQFLYVNSDFQQWGNAGGLVFTGPNANNQFYPTNAQNPFVGGALAGLTPNYSNLVGRNPDVSNTGNLNSPLLTSWNPTYYTKLEYDNNLNSSTFLQLRYYNWQTLQGTSNDSGTQAFVSGFGLGAGPVWGETGGPRVGGTFDLTKQVGTKSTLTLSAKYETSHPIWNEYDPNALIFLSAVGAGGPGGVNYADFLPGGYLTGNNTNGPGGTGVNYFPKGVPQIPTSGINYNGAYFQTFGVGLRWQYAPTDRLKFDLGLRNDQQFQHYGTNPFNPTGGNNPSDVNPANITSKFLDPSELQPRTSVSYQAGRNDAFNFSYGRSVVFLNAQTAGTPAGLLNAGPFTNIPAPAGAVCGSGVAGAPAIACQNYAQALYWLYDQHFDAPDLGGALPAIYSNYDFTYQHLFKDGIGIHLTPFYKLGTNLPSFALVPSPLAAGAFVFTANNQGLNRTTGAELGVNTPDVRVGFSAFLSATYQNVLGTTPPLIAGEDALPINGSGSLALGDIYRAGYVSPFSTRVGASYKTRNGFRITPILQYDRGYPYDVGSTIASGAPVNGGGFANIPQVNFGPGTTAIPGFQFQSGTTNSTQYYDPSFSGSALNPNIIATRGTPQSSNSGGILWTPNLAANLVLEYKHDRNTFGIQFQNLFGNAYNGSIPQINPYYQPVANGVSGPLTGVNPFNGLKNQGFANIPTNIYAFSNGAYLLLPARPMTTTVYYQLGL